jgi:branched-chain amino acid transport system permease protein
MRIWLPQGFEAWRFVVYPIVLLLVMLLRPQGLLGKFEFGFLRAPKWPLRQVAAEAAPQVAEATAGNPEPQEERSA